MAETDAAIVGDDGIIATRRGGLTYPWGERVPATGEALTLAPGVRWARMPMPGSLAHINVWLLDDRDDAGHGVAIVDTGLDLPDGRTAWEALFADALAGVRITRVIGTHCHPDHVGLAGWLCARDDAPLVMTRAEWLTARLLQIDARDEPPATAFAWWRMAGYDPAQIAAAAAQGWRRYARVTSPIAARCRILAHGDVVTIGARDWRVVIGHGHSPEHACLIDDAGGLMIAGDQVLPRITSNVSVSPAEPDGDPLGAWLASIERLRALDPALTVLPGHGEPFTGLHARLDTLRDSHLGRLDALHAMLDVPRTALECFGALFSRAIGDDVRGLAAGEALAHLHRLVADGRARRRWEDGVARFVAA